MKTLIKGGAVLDLKDTANPLIPADVLIEDEAIAAVIRRPYQTQIQADKYVEAVDKLLMPGLVNAHIHSETHLQKGLYEGLPLEIWLPCIIPVLEDPGLNIRMVYLSAMLGAVHMLKRGITTIIDHWIDSVPLAEGFSSVVGAYEEAGIRALVGIDYSNKPIYEEIPLLGNILPASLKERLFAACSTGEDYVDNCRKLTNKYGDKKRRVHAMLSFSAIQRCSDRLLRELGELSRETGLMLHGHMLETRSQYIGARHLYSEGIVQHIDKLGLLNDSLLLAHSIWVTKEEAKMMGNRGVSVVHNPVSNLKLGSGIMPLRMLRETGVNIALGTDGASSNDNLNLFEVMKFTALKQTIDDVDFRSWPLSAEVIRYATEGGARAAGLDKSIGTIETGKKADIVIVDLDNTTHLPVNNILRQLVYCEDGRNVETVIIDGKTVVEGGVVKTVNEKSLLTEIKAVQAEYQDRMKGIAETNKVLLPYLEELYFESIQEFEQMTIERTGKKFNLKEE